MTDLVDAARVYAEARTRFKHRGRVPAVGLDCAGLMVRAYADLGVTVHDCRTYGREPFHNGLESHVALALGPAVKVAPVAESDLQHCDVVVFRFFVNPHHLALVARVEYDGVPAFNIIHADGMAGFVVEHRLTPDMIARITHVHRRAA
jgi:hypothetical protein